MSKEAFSESVSGNTIIGDAGEVWTLGRSGADFARIDRAAQAA